MFSNRLDRPGVLSAASSPMPKETGVVLKVFVGLVAKCNCLEEVSFLKVSFFEVVTPLWPSSYRMMFSNHRTYHRLHL